MDTDNTLSIADAIQWLEEVWHCKVTRATVASWCRRYENVGFAKKSMPVHGAVWCIDKKHFKEFINGQEAYEKKFNLDRRQPGRPKNEIEPSRRKGHRPKKTGA